MFENFRSWAERQCNRKILAIQIDNTKEYLKLGKCLAQLGISHRISAPYSHQQMGSVEQRHRHLIDTTITMFRHANLPNKFWDFAVLTTGYLYNHNPTPLLARKSLLEAFLGKTPEYSRLRVFGSACYPCLRPYRSNKLGSKSTQCIFLGYSLTQDCYLSYDPIS